MHVVEKGETLEKIARRYGVKAKDLAAWNNLDGNVIKTGQKLVIYKGEPTSLPPPVVDAAPAEETIEHLVLPGQTLQKIAVQYGTTVKKLLELNKMDKSDPLLADKKIRVPKPGE
ncbi:MAG TPA: LysM peptidoglycan-binding domain-containing protein [Candidatus Hydrogenedentes bacterium]|nr:LysM peptidoglycan-binding domain-containing protein [Candidatus Hydrogenedentota bacterium]